MTAAIRETVPNPPQPNRYFFGSAFFTSDALAREKQWIFSNGRARLDKAMRNPSK